jgi:hypothetical protein
VCVSRCPARGKPRLHEGKRGHAHVMTRRVAA